MLNVSLPKWPACRVVGKSVTKEQAAEIILKTDSALPNFHHASNCYIKNKEYSSVFDFDVNDNENYEKAQDIRFSLGILELEYLYNERILSSYIGGPNGWVNWDGKIEYNKNIGKWPYVEEVRNEWIKIANTFPYLDLRCQLFNGEYCEDNIIPIIEFIVCNVNVTTKEPSDVIILPYDKDEDIINNFFNPDREVGISVLDLIEKRNIVWPSKF